MLSTTCPEVLVVEDEDSIAEALTEILRVEGFEVRTTARSDDAREMIRQRRPSMILLDFMLAAGATSEGLLSELVADPTAPRVLLYSASSAAVAIAHRHGVPFLAKPFDIDVLVRAMRSLLAAEVMA